MAWIQPRPRNSPRPRNRLYNELVICVGSRQCRRLCFFSRLFVCKISKQSSCSWSVQLRRILKCRHIKGSVSRERHKLSKAMIYLRYYSALLIANVALLLLEIAGFIYSDLVIEFEEEGNTDVAAKTE